MILSYKKECPAASDKATLKSVAFNVVDRKKKKSYNKIENNPKGLIYMKKLLINIFTNTGFIITFIYGILNLAAIVDAQGNMSFIGDFVLGIDVFTWHIYGIFSIATLLVKIYSDSKAVDNATKAKWLDAQSVLHIVFMLLSFGGIYYLFENCF